MMYVVAKKFLRSESVYETDFDKLEEEYPKKDAFYKMSQKSIEYYIYDNDCDMLYIADVSPISIKNFKTVNKRNLSKLFFSIYVCERYIKFEVASFRGNGNVYREVSSGIVDRITNCILDFEEKSRNMRR
jgi:hypothetical protein